MMRQDYHKRRTSPAPAEEGRGLRRARPDLAVGHSRARRARRFPPDGALEPRPTPEAPPGRVFWSCRGGPRRNAGCASDRKGRRGPSDAPGRAFCARTIPTGPSGLLNRLISNTRRPDPLGLPIAVSARFASAARRVGAAPKKAGSARGPETVRQNRRVRPGARDFNRLRESALMRLRTRVCGVGVDVTEETPMDSEGCSVFRGGNDEI